MTKRDQRNLLGYAAKEILDANGSNYIIVPADVGQVISVRVKPISDDGVRGKTAVASMQNTVDDGATKFSMTIVNELDLESDENVGVEETLEAIFRDGFDDSPLLSLPIDISHSYDSTGKSPLTSVQYITSGLRLAPVRRHNLLASGTILARCYLAKRLTKSRQSCSEGQLTLR